MEKTLSCIVVDDDPEVNDYVCEMIRQTPFLQLAASFSSAPAALGHLETTKVELLVLDINLPGIDGVTFAGTLRDLPGHAAPRVILISGSRDYALDGYKVNAVDYLVKPFSYDDFYKAALKVRELTSKPEASSVPADFLFLKVEHDLVRVNIADIKYLESDKDYVKVVTAEKVITALSTLKALEEKLQGHRFMRIHRSFVVNLNLIESIQHLTVRFGKTVIPVTEQYREAFKAAFREWL